MVNVPLPIGSFRSQLKTSAVSPAAISRSLLPDDKVDLVLLMSVNPGFGGQQFIQSTLGKLAEARTIIDACNSDIRLEVDGGVKVDNIAEIARAGADTFVADSAIFGAGDNKDANRYDTVINKMREQLAAVK